MHKPKSREDEAECGSVPHVIRLSRPLFPTRTSSDEVQRQKQRNTHGEWDELESKQNAMIKNLISGRLSLLFGATFSYDIRSPQASARRTEDGWNRASAKK